MLTPDRCRQLARLSDGAAVHFEAAAGDLPARRAWCQRLAQMHRDYAQCARIVERLLDGGIESIDIPTTADEVTP